MSTPKIPPLSRSLSGATQRIIGFIPWFPPATGKLSEPGGPLAEISQRSGHSPSQRALAWLLKRSPVMLPIPGTSSVAHVEENIAAALIELSDEDFEALARAVA
jgi:pyridoxine 4-dehydrogenase